MDVITIVDKLKNNKWLVFKVDTLETFNLLEDALLKNGYTWGGYDNPIKLLDHIKPYGINTSIHLNYMNRSKNKMKILYSLNNVNDSVDDNCFEIDFIITKDNNNIRYIRQIFKIEPDYTPRKNIRTL